jgi:hypothetical protein
VWPQLPPDKLGDDAVKHIFTKLGEYVAKADFDVTAPEDEQSMYALFLHSTSPDDDLSFLVNVLFEWE